MTNQNKTMLTVSFVFAIVQEAIMAFSLIFFGSSVIAQSPTLYSALNSGIINILLALMVISFIALIVEIVNLWKAKKLDSRVNLKIALIASIIAMVGNIGLFTITSLVLNILVLVKSDK